MAFDNEPKSPYYSTRVRISDVTSPKAWIGYKERTIEVTYGNQEFRDIPSENPQDIGDTAKKSLKDEILEAFRITDEVAEERKFKFVDQTKKNDKNEPFIETKYPEVKEYENTGVATSQ